MATNTTVLIVVTAIAAFVLAGMIVGVVYKTRASRRNVNGTTIRDQAEEDALRLRRQEMLADEFGARAHAAQVEIDIKTVRACSLHQQATVHRGEAVTSRDQLNELRDSADKLTAAAQPPRSAPALSVTDWQPTASPRTARLWNRGTRASDRSPHW
jgi:hypothetical protein